MDSATHDITQLRQRMIETARLIAAARNLKHQTALSVAYGAGLRARGDRAQGR